MSTKYRRGVAAKLATVLGIAGLACGALMPAQAGQEQNGQWLDEPTLQRVAAGYAATPVGVDLKDKDPVQVGLGSYIVNTTGICNHCHSSNQFYKAGFPLTTSDPSGQKGNPYFLSKSQGGIYTGGKRPDGGAAFQLDPSTFVAGGQQFGPPSPTTITSKNLTPDLNGDISTFAPHNVNYAAGGMDWITFWATLHNGVDIDTLYQQCNAGTPIAPANPAATNGCANLPQNAGQLQVMPWPVVRQMTDSDLNAVWQYLSAIPCTTNQPPNINANVAVTENYGGGILAQACTKPGNYKFYKYANGQVVPDNSRH